MVSPEVAAPVTSNPDERGQHAMAIGFGIGSTLFALGTVLLWLGPVVAANVTYVLGALCFTGAATVQWRVAVRHNPDRGSMGARAEWDLTNADWLSAVTQLVGTLYFNVMTIAALVQSLGADITAEQVWRPDVYGSILFLVSSAIALAPASRERRHGRIRRQSWWICALNMLGSIFFGMSAWGQAVLSDGAMRSEALANWGTFLGALGFLGASVLLWPHRKTGKGP